MYSLKFNLDVLNKNDEKENIDINDYYSDNDNKNS
jgi:hypothetical protein